MKQSRHRKICDSWYHQSWFRVLLVIVGVDMIILGGAVAVGLDIVSVLESLPAFVRVIGGLAYIVVALFIIHYAMSYRSIKKEAYLLCQHCAAQTEA